MQLVAFGNGSAAAYVAAKAANTNRQMSPYFATDVSGSLSDVNAHIPVVLAPFGVISKLAMGLRIINLDGASLGTEETPFLGHCYQRNSNQPLEYSLTVDCREDAQTR